MRLCVKGLNKPETFPKFLIPSHILPFSQDIKLDEMSRYFRDQPFLLQTSFNDPNSREEMGANMEAAAILGERCGCCGWTFYNPRHSFGPVRNKSYACDL
ncbi:unnamed protein product [Larinioides sclopetarius]|uniref:Uncharacterized protein n=1 Tax=Larinioides sclopetarius TaxID=280406 RepID=A0AAV2BZT3_9ARAC